MLAHQPSCVLLFSEEVFEIQIPDHINSHTMNLDLFTGISPPRSLHVAEKLLWCLAGTKDVTRPSQCFGQATSIGFYIFNNLQVGVIKPCQIFTVAMWWH